MIALRAKGGHQRKSRVAVPRGVDGAFLRPQEKSGPNAGVGLNRASPVVFGAHRTILPLLSNSKLKTTFESLSAFILVFRKELSYLPASGQTIKQES